MNATLIAILVLMALACDAYKAWRWPCITSRYRYGKGVFENLYPAAADKKSGGKCDQNQW